MNKKTVIHVFTNNCCNIKYNSNDTSSYWGIGDLIRGSIKLYQYSQIMNFNYYIDISLHPISKYLINLEHPYKQLVIDNKDKIEYFYIDTLKQSLKKKLKDKNDKSIIMLTTNDRIIETLSVTDECKTFILNIFTPNPKFKEYLDKYISSIGKNKCEYDICHFRMGDDLLIKENNDTIFENKLNTIESFLNKYIINDYISVDTDILLTDNKYLKQYVLDNNIMFTPNTIIKHLGIDDSNDIYEDYGTRDTLVEFFLLLNSKSIKTYTCYSWISGFVFWISVLKNIPIVILKKL